MVHQTNFSRALPHHFRSLSKELRLLHILGMVWLNSMRQMIICCQVRSRLHSRLLTHVSSQACLPCISSPAESTLKLQFQPIFDTLLLRNQVRAVDQHFFFISQETKILHRRLRVPVLMIHWLTITHVLLLPHNIQPEEDSKAWNLDCTNLTFQALIWTPGPNTPA